MRVAVVGHVEWVEFVRLARVPRAGEIAHASASWAQAGGGGSVAALQLAALAGRATLLTALGSDAIGVLARDELTARGLNVAAAARSDAQRRAITFVDAAGERTITLLSPKLHPLASDPLPWDELAGADGVYFTAGDVGALRAARRARLLVATARELPTLAQARVGVDVLVHSGSDEGERYAPGNLEPAPRIVVRTAGEAGGTYTVEGGAGGRYRAALVPGPIADSYGAGDCFAAGLTFALAAGRSLEDALDLAARCGAAALAGSGVHVARPRE